MFSAALSKSLLPWQGEKVADRPDERGLFAGSDAIKIKCLTALPRDPRLPATVFSGGLAAAWCAGRPAKADRTTEYGETRRHRSSATPWDEAVLLFAFTECRAYAVPCRSVPWHEQ